VVSLNSTVASLAVTMFASAVTGLPDRARHQIIRFETGVVRAIGGEQAPECVVCSRAGALAAAMIGTGLVDCETVRSARHPVDREDAAAFADRGLGRTQAAFMPVTESAARASAPSARAIVLEFDGDISAFVALVRRVVNALVDHGLLVVLCHRHPKLEEATVLQQIDQSVLKTAEHPRYMDFVGQRWDYLAYRTLTHDPGPGATTPVRVDTKTTDPTVKLFVRRAFWDFETVRCELLAEQGFSGSQVMLVHPSRSGGPSDCFLPNC